MTMLLLPALLLLLRLEAGQSLRGGRVRPSELLRLRRHAAGALEQRAEVALGGPVRHAAHRSSAHRSGGRSRA